jgi:LuxR family transcriptional regulator
MLKRTNIAHLIGALHESSPSGFAVALHITYATPAFLFQSYPQEWMQEYSQRGLHLQDPTVMWGFTHTGSIRWSELASQDPAGVFESARAFGLIHGVTVAILMDGTRTVASFAREDREFDDDEIAKISAVLTQLHHETAGGKGLSEADREALKSMSIRLTHA